MKMNSDREKQGTNFVREVNKGKNRDRGIQGKTIWTK